MNVRTLRSESLRNELLDNCKTHVVPLLGLVDHRIVHDKDILNYSVADRTITFFDWRGTNTISGDIDIVIDRTAEGALVNMEWKNKRTVVRNFFGN